MNGELGPLHVRSVGIVDRRTVPPVTRVAPRVTAVGRPVRLEGEEKRDVLDTVIAKAENIRLSTIGAFPVAVVEDMWTKLNNFAIDVTPSIPLLPAEVALR